MQCLKDNHYLELLGTHHRELKDFEFMITYVVEDVNTVRRAKNLPELRQEYYI